MEREKKMNIDRDIAGLEPIVKEEMILIRKDEYKNSLITPNDFKLICDHILTKKDIKKLKQQGVKI